MSETDQSEVIWTPAWRLREMMARRELSPVEYAQALLARTDRLNGSLGAFITVFPEHLLKAARAAEDAVMRGDALGPLHGLPISLKDYVWTKGQRTTMGSLLLEDFIPDRDSVVSERIKAAGGVIFAKANTPEFSMNPRTVNLVSNEALNPWDTTRSSGGSSGGSGVAVAAGLGPLSVGSDDGGSIRLPSAFNGVFGLLPSRGRVPNGAGFFHAPACGIGPIARDVRDAAMLFQVLAGYDARDPFAMKDDPPDCLAGLEDGVRDVRIAWSADLGRVRPDTSACVDIIHEAARAFEALGARYEEPSFRLEDPLDLLERDANYTLRQLGAQFAAVTAEYKDSAAWLSQLPPEDYAKLTIYVRDRTPSPTQLEYTMSIAPAVRNRVRTSMADLFTRHDLVLCPTIGRTAFVAGEPGITPWQYVAYTYIVNASGYCAASVPAGFHQGAPVGLQIIGRPNEEALVLRAARAFEKVRPWTQHRPALP